MWPAKFFEPLKTKFNYPWFPAAPFPSVISVI